MLAQSYYPIPPTPSSTTSSFIVNVANVGLSLLGQNTLNVAFPVSAFPMEDTSQFIANTWVFRNTSSTAAVLSKTMSFAVAVIYASNTVTIQVGFPVNV